LARRGLAGRLLRQMVSKPPLMPGAALLLPETKGRILTTEAA
jgi:hypothetical protein